MANGHTQTNDRFCTSCGEAYYRRHLAEAWVARNRGGFVKMEKVQSKLCMACLPQRKVRAFVAVVEHGLPSVHRRLLERPVVEIALANGNGNGRHK